MKTINAAVIKDSIAKYRALNKKNAAAFANKVERYDPENGYLQFSKSKLLSINFIDDNISFEEVKKRADQYNIPILHSQSELPIFRFTDESGYEHEKDKSGFQVMFLTNTPFDASRAKIMLRALRNIFPECYRKMPEKHYNITRTDAIDLIYFDKNIPEISADSLMYNMSLYLKDKYGDPAYKEYIEKFAEDNNISLTSTNSIVTPLLENISVPKANDITIPKEPRATKPETTNSNATRKFNFSISLDSVGYKSKPKDHEVGKINNRIGQSPHSVDKNSISEVVEAIAISGHSFAPATFKNGKRSKEHFEQMQAFALDIDGGLSFDEFKARTDRYELPLLFAYETMSSVDQNKFRIAFLNDASITDVRVADMMQQALMTIFPEADRQCKNIDHMYFGGKNLMYFDESAPTINPESLVRSMSIYLQDKYGDTNYKRKLQEFSKNTKVALTSKNLPDVKVVEDLPELDKITETGSGANDEINKISPTHYVYIMGNGENLLNKYYRIRFDDCCTSNHSVDQNDKKESMNHKDWRKPDIEYIRSQCRLFREFENGTERLHHDELFGLATNLIQVESGDSLFKSILKEHSKYKEYVEKYDYWKNNLKYIKQNNYKPQSCKGFCPHKGKCRHGANILSSSKVKDNHIEVLANCEPELVSLEEAREDVRKTIFNALDANDNYIHVVKGATSTGKSESYLAHMEENPDDYKFTAASTNLLKNDLMGRAKKMRIPDVRVSPSLHEIRSDIPSDVWNQIQNFWDTGRHKSVDMYIKKLIEKNDKRCAKVLDDYLQKKKDFNNFHGNVFTTHKKFIMMNDETLSKFNNIIIDEDFIFKTVATNHETVTISELEALKDELGTGNSLYKKIKEILKYAAEKKFLFTLEPIEWEDENDDDKDTPNYNFDVPSMCRAKHFCFREASKEPNLKEDSISFMKPLKLPKRKLIIASATADEKVYNYFFKDNIVKFYNCKIPRLVGNLDQYPDETMSRDCLSKGLGMLDYIQKVTRFIHMITFKMFNRGPMWFGNAEGFDGWRGLSYNIVGTPHYPPWIYFLFASSLELDFDEKAKLEPRIIEHNGCRVKFATFDDEVLRAIQFWMIESDLEQAIGRARLAIEKDCTVNVFSNFPILQARQGKFDWSNYSK